MLRRRRPRGGRRAREPGAAKIALAADWNVAKPWFSQETNTIVVPKETGRIQEYLVHDIVGFSFDVFGEASRDDVQGQLLIVRRALSLSRAEWTNWARLLCLSLAAYLAVAYTLGPITAGLIFFIVLTICKRIPGASVAFLSRTGVLGVLWIVCTELAPRWGGLWLTVSAWETAVLLLLFYREKLFSVEHEALRIPTATYPIAITYYQHQLSEMLNLRTQLIKACRPKIQAVCVGSYWVEVVCSLVLHHDMYNSPRLRLVGHIVFTYFLPLVFTTQLLSIALPWLWRQMVTLVYWVHGDVGLQAVASLFDFIDLPLPGISGLLEVIESPALIFSSFMSMLSRWLVPLDELVTYIRVKLSPIHRLLARLGWLTVASELFEDVRDFMEDTFDVVIDHFDDIFDRLQDAFEFTTDLMGIVYELLENVIEFLQDVLENLFEWTTETVEVLGNAVKRPLGALVEASNEVMKLVRHFMEPFVRVLEDRLEEPLQYLKAYFPRAARTIRNLRRMTPKRPHTPSRHNHPEVPTFPSRFGASIKSSLSSLASPMHPSNRSMPTSTDSDSHPFDLNRKGRGPHQFLPGGPRAGNAMADPRLNALLNGSITSSEEGASSARRPSPRKISPPARLRRNGDDSEVVPTAAQPAVPGGKPGAADEESEWTELVPPTPRLATDADQSQQVDRSAFVSRSRANSRVGTIRRHHDTLAAFIATAPVARAPVEKQSVAISTESPPASNAAVVVPTPATPAPPPAAYAPPTAVPPPAPAPAPAATRADASEQSTAVDAHSPPKLQRQGSVIDRLPAFATLTGTEGVGFVDKAAATAAAQAGGWGAPPPLPAPPSPSPGTLATALDMSGSSGQGASPSPERPLRRRRTNQARREQLLRELHARKEAEALGLPFDKDESGSSLGVRLRKGSASESFDWNKDSSPTSQLSQERSTGRMSRDASKDFGTPMAPRSPLVEGSPRHARSPQDSPSGREKAPRLGGERSPPRAGRDSPLCGERSPRRRRSPRMSPRRDGNSPFSQSPQRRESPGRRNGSEDNRNRGNHGVDIVITRHSDRSVSEQAAANKLADKLGGEKDTRRRMSDEPRRNNGLVPVSSSSSASPHASCDEPKRRRKRRVKSDEIPEHGRLDAGRR